MLTQNLRILFGLALALLAAPAYSENLFVDFQSGQDSNSGVSKEAPWQHAPGDPNASARASDYTLQPGDAVYFKGGVEYLGNIVIADDGAPGKPITYRGSAWGEKRAIISGAKPLDLTLAPCASQNACYDNPNWQNLYIAKLKDSIDPLSVVFLGEERLWLAREPNQPDPFWFDDIDHYSVVDGFGKELTSSSLTLGSDLKDRRAADWENALIAVWMKPNVVMMRNVQKIDDQSGTVFFEPVKNKPYTDRDSYYAFFNRPLDVDQPGEFAVDNNRNTILLWPKNAGAINNVPLRMSQREVGIDINGKSNITIEGFQISNFSGGIEGWNKGTAILNADRTSENLIVRNNVIRDLRSAEGVGAIQLNKVKNAVVEYNTIVDNEKSSGIRFGGGDDIVVRNNLIKRIGRTGIRLIRTENVQISDNVISSIRGGHGNGISVYLENKNILVANNVVDDTPRAFTYHGTGKPGEAENLWVLNNVFLGRVNSWGKKFSSVYFLQNLIYAPDDRSKSLRIPGNEPKTVLKNNIIDGFLIKPRYVDWDLSYNLYTSLSQRQSSKYHWFMEDGSEVDDSMVDSINDFKKGGPPGERPVGENIAKYLPTTLFKGFDFSYWNQKRAIGPNRQPAQPKSKAN